MTTPALHSDKLPKSTLPRKSHPDRFMCPWGVFPLDQYPYMPARWLAYQKAGLAYPGIDALFCALADMLRIESERDIIPTGELTLTENGQKQAVEAPKCASVVESYPKLIKTPLAPVL